MTKTLWFHLVTNTFFYKQGATGLDMTLRQVISTPSPDGEGGRELRILESSSGAAQLFKSGITDRALSERAGWQGRTLVQCYQG